MSPSQTEASAVGDYLYKSYFGPALLPPEFSQRVHEPPLFDTLRKFCFNWNHALTAVKNRRMEAALWTFMVTLTKSNKTLENESMETIRPTRSWVQILVWICWSGDLSFPPTPQLKSWSNSCVSPLSFDPIFKVNFTLFSVSFLGLYSWRWCLFFYLILNRTLIFNSVKY